MTTTNYILGVDIGGTGIKGALVNTATGQLVGDRYRLPTPQPATPNRVAGVLNKIKETFDWQGPIGCGFPAVVQQGFIHTAINVDDSWIGVDAVNLFSSKVNCPISMINDADAAGLAEVRFGVGKATKGLVMMITLGTGIGTALFNNGQLVPNIELGQVTMPNGMIAEKYAANSVRKREQLAWEVWGKRVNEYLNYVEKLVAPDLIIIGGGVSKKAHMYEQYLQTLKGTKIAFAQLKNKAGIVGAALAAM